MAHKEREEGQISTPQRFPEVPPPEVGLPYSNFILQTVMELQKAVGQMTQAVTTLTHQVEKQGEKLDKISHRVYAAGVIITALLAAGGFFLSKIWDVLIAALKASH